METLRRKYLGDGCVASCFSVLKLVFTGVCIGTRAPSMVRYFPHGIHTWNSCWSLRWGTDTRSDHHPLFSAHDKPLGNLYCVGVVLRLIVFGLSASPPRQREARKKTQIQLCFTSEGILIRKPRLSSKDVLIR